MYMEEVLEILKSNVSIENYDRAKIFMESRGKFLGIFKRKFKLTPCTYYGYKAYRLEDNFNCCDWMVMY